MPSADSPKESFGPSKENPSLTNDLFQAPGDAYTMPVQKFRSFEDAEHDLWVFVPDDRYFERLRNFYKFASRFLVVRRPTQILKFRSIQEANAQADSLLWEGLESLQKTDGAEYKSQITSINWLLSFGMWDLDSGI